MITVDMFPGRTAEQKRALVRELTEAMVRTCDAKPEGVWVVLREVEPENWAIGGTLASER
ncbi:4-oxalocrotonate tautomerase family protein [Umezawaea endophytica]|uniref:Tautomerase n=1 Tax=Umezawaea endophytica TaxID=1654476 RepID=A0A9X3A5M0_9PSEU|nr:4-oxalocrotonate tautomerase family protein [Umezawaea endophytica]MCS7482398.1 4-oxalocrotonate tautomerase family protein [Umezawaea endophytica]